MICNGFSVMTSKRIFITCTFLWWTWKTEKWVWCFWLWIWLRRIFSVCLLFKFVFRLISTPLYIYIGGIHTRHSYHYTKTLKNNLFYMFSFKRFRKRHGNILYYLSQFVWNLWLLQSRAIFRQTYKAKCFFNIIGHTAFVLYYRFFPYS